MTETAHTPGPWVSEGSEVMAYGDCEYHPVADASCNPSCRSDVETEANARLIASAPEMLGALEEILRVGNGLRTDMEFGAACWDNVVRMRSIAEDAINKATERPTLPNNKS